MRFSEYLESHYSFYRTLILQLGLHCPLRCRHCSVYAAPGRPERMAPELVLESIRDFASGESARVVVLTGGEPFALGELLAPALDEIARHPHLAGYVITSANWATSPAEARRVLGELPPIALLTVSADAYHEEFLPLARVAHAVHAALAAGTSVCLSIAVEPERPGYEKRVREAVGEEAWPLVECDVVRVMPTGRARNYGIGSFDTVPAPLPEGACELLGTPVVVHDGSVSACCQIDATNEVARRLDSPYRLGRLPDQRYRELRRRVDEDALFQALRVWGPAELVRRLRAAGVEPKLEPSYDGICFLCRDLLGDPETVRRLRELLAPEPVRNDIRLSRMLQYGELRPCPAAAGA